MYEVGQYIVHPGQGVCKVEAVSGEPTQTYILMPVGGRHPMKISFPVAGEDRLRPVLSKDEARELIGSYTSLPTEKLSGKSNALEEERVKDKLRRGNCRDAVVIVKTFRKRIQEVEAENRKPPVVFERILRQASERSLQELAVALEVSPEDVKALFEQEVANVERN